MSTTMKESITECPITECPICVEKMNKSTRKGVICNKCDYSACRACYKQYLLSTNDNPHCMNCKNQWLRSVLVDMFDNTFVNITYKLHRENVLLERERSKMASTQPHVERIIKNRKNELELYNLNKLKKEISIKISDIKIRNYLSESEDVDVERKVFTKKCTWENCRGYLSSQWKCGLCENWSCPECHVVVGLEKGVEKSGIPHVCEPDTVSTVKLLNLDTKDCPKCSTSIYKIDGCDMMFCTICTTSFSWKTGKLETGVIHNPHYYEWLRQNGNIERNPGDIPCGHEVDQYFIQNINLMIRPRTRAVQQYFERFRLCQNNLIHLRYVVLNDFRVRADDNLKLRVSYMMNEIDFGKFKRLLQAREKQMSKKQEYFDIINMFITCETDISYRIQDILQNAKAQVIEANYLKMFGPLLNESDGLLLYTNDCLSNISKLYNTTKYYLNENFKFDSCVDGAK